MPIFALTTSVIDANAVDSLMTVVKSVMGLFTEYPLNIYLIAGIVGIGLGIFAKAKRTGK